MWDEAMNDDVDVMKVPSDDENDAVSGCAVTMDDAVEVWWWRWLAVAYAFWEEGGEEMKGVATPPGFSSTCVCAQLPRQLRTSLAQLTYRPAAATNVSTYHTIM